MQTLKLKIFVFALAAASALSSPGTATPIIEFGPVAAGTHSFQQLGGRLRFRVPGTNTVDTNEQLPTNPVPIPTRNITMLNQNTSPIRATNGNPGTVSVFTPLVANNGDYDQGGVAKEAPGGSVNQGFAVASTWRVVDANPPPNTNTVTVLLSGVIKGRAAAKAITSIPPSQATGAVLGELNIAPFGKFDVSAGASSTGLVVSPELTIGSTSTIKLIPSNPADTKNSNFTFAETATVVRGESKMWTIRGGGQFIVVSIDLNSRLWVR